MDESILENAEIHVLAMTDAEVLRRRKLAIPDGALAPEQYKQLECEHCGLDLPLFRLQKGLIFCVPCQTRKEAGKLR